MIRAEIAWYEVDAFVNPERYAEMEYEAEASMGSAADRDEGPGARGKDPGMGRAR